MKTSPRNTEKNMQGERIPDHFFRELQIEYLIHELKDPVMVVEAGARTLLEKKFGPLSARQEKTLRRILRGALKSRSMLSNLLEIGRSETGRFNPLPFLPAKTVYACLLESIETVEGEFFEEVSKEKTEREAMTVLAQAGIFIDTASDLDGMEIVQDKAAFCQIVGNLIKNALHFRKERLEIKVFRDGDLLVAEISDDGPGIDREHCDLIFELYARVHAPSTVTREGHGLGLAGARILARRLGGDVIVQSEEGKGAMFRLTLPVKVEAEDKS
jgi:two-component system OmpR family sensor kinase